MTVTDSRVYGRFAREVGHTRLEFEIVAVVAIGGDGCIIGWSDGAEAMFGYRRADVLGRDLAGTVMPGRLRSPHRDLLAAPGSGLRRFEQIVRRADGSTFPAEVAIMPSAGEEAQHIALVRDITQRREDQSPLARSDRTRDLLSYVVESSDDAILTQRPDGTITSWNAGAERLYGYSAAEAIGQPVSMLAPHERGEEQADLNRRVFAGESIRHQEAERVRKDDARMLVSLTISPVRDPTGRIISAAVVGRDVTRRGRLERRLRHLADHDPLTGLFNRRRFEQELRRELARTVRHGSGGAVLSIDLDQFKQVNDTGGHAAGDALLSEVAHTLRRTLRESDVPARLGGDEFVVLLPETSSADARTVAQHLLTSLREMRVEIDGDPINATASIGGIGFTGGETNGDDLLVAADLAMYAAKEQGRNQLVVLTADEAQRSRAGLHVSWSRRIRDALEHDGLVLHAQPIVDISSGEVDHQELLLRMRQDGGLVEPAAFLGAAERLGLIHAIDRWVVRRAVALLAGDKAPHRGPLSINVSGASVAGDAGLPGLIRAELAAHGVDPAMLIFELAETAAVTDMVQARRFAAGVRELGCRVAIDDFGAGFGSFLYLKHLPTDFIKIDPEFVLDLADNDVDQRLVRSIADVAHGLSVATVAEAVSDARTLELLREMGVQYAQGFHLGPPVPVA